MSRSEITKGFWFDRLAVNARQAIYHQWEQLEASGCFENFRIAAGESEGVRVGWFFADSDAYKWLEAAARIWGSSPDDRLGALIDATIDLLDRAQMEDGYLFTYNQIHFPGTRWENLQIEHELYCHGHLIEAGVAHFEATGRTNLLNIGRQAADRIAADFKGKGAAYTPGHEEIEIALLRLHAITEGDSNYLEMARQFIEQRGRNRPFAWSIFRQNLQVNRRRELVEKKKQEYVSRHPDFQPFQLPPGNLAKKAFNSSLRWYASALTGKYFQQHVPVRQQDVPVGHSVRFAYLQTAVAMLAKESGDSSLLPTLQQSWDRMVMRRMYVTGGIGSLAGTEGFGRDYELDPEYAYAETCAGLGSMFWNWQMVQLTGEAKYSDLFEWQLYNAAGVGMGLDGTSYLYNNPLSCRDGVERKPWYAVPCCPSNLSRTWADLGSYIYSGERHTLCIHQYISSHLSNFEVFGEQGQQASVSLEMESGIPWQDRVRIRIAEISRPDSQGDGSFDLKLRQPSWAAEMTVEVNGNPALTSAAVRTMEGDQPASGYDPRLAVFRSVSRAWVAGDVVDISFSMPVVLRRADRRVKGHQGKAAITRGPLVYCLESVDNPDLNIFDGSLAPDTLLPVFEPDLLGGVVTIQGKTNDGKPLLFIPYCLWGNRGPGQMTVWVNTQ
jgi:uncharacterized protein